MLESESLAQRVSVTFSDTVLQFYLQLIKKKILVGHTKHFIYGLTDEHVLTNLTYEGNGRSEGGTDNNKSRVSKRVLESIYDLQS